MARNRSMVKLIHADGFFPPQDVVNLRNVVQGFNFVEKEYGYELPDFNLIFPNIETTLYHVLGERVTVDPDRSGVIRRPFNHAIHFESFDSPNEWVFIVALEATQVNLWHHISDTSMGELSPADSRSVFEGMNFNYRNLFEWKIHTNIMLEPNQGLFIRPWVFHSLEDGLVQYYRLIADQKYRILVMGMPESAKSEITHQLSQRFAECGFESCTVINSMQQRHLARDLDFTVNGQIRHCHRLLKQARASKSDLTIIDMCCPIPEMREVLNPDFLIWADVPTVSQYSDLTDMFVPPMTYDAACSTASDKELQQLIHRIKTKRI